MEQPQKVMFTKTYRIEGTSESFKQVTVSDSMLDRINRHALKPLSMDEVYVRKFRLAHDQVDRDFEHFTSGILGDFAETGNQGRSFLIGHAHWTAPIGRIFDCHVHQDGGTKWLECLFYTKILNQNEEVRGLIDAGVHKDVSIGFWADKLLCDICDKPIYSMECPHRPGQVLTDGKTVTARWEGPGEMMEASIVYMGSQPGASFVKSLGGTGVEVSPSIVVSPTDTGSTSIAVDTTTVYATPYVDTDVSPIATTITIKTVPPLEPFEDGSVNPEEKKWDQTTNFITYRVRDPGLFRSETFRTSAWSGVEGLLARYAKYKPENVPEGRNPDSMVLQSLMFSKEKWTLEKAKKWVADHADSLKAADEVLPDDPSYEALLVNEEGEQKSEDPTEEEKSASGSLSLPLAPEETAWSFSAADGNEILGSSDSPNWSAYASVHFWKDPDKADKREGYKLPFAKKIDGTVKVVWRGVAAAHAAMRGARRAVDIPEGDKSAVLSRIKHYYKRFGKPWPADSDGKELPTEPVSLAFHEIIWYNDEKSAFEEINVRSYVESIGNIMKHWVKEGRDLSPLLEELREMLSSLHPAPGSGSGDPPTVPEEPKESNDSESTLTADAILSVLQ